MVKQLRASQTSVKPQKKKAVKLMDISDAAKLIEVEYPGRLRYKFTVDCAGVRNCTIVKQHMKDEHFKISNKKTTRGDHSGMKQFDSYASAYKSFSSLYKKFGTGKSPKINNVYLGLEIVEA